MKTHTVLLLFLVTYVSASVLFHQPVGKNIFKRQNYGDEQLLDEEASSGPTPPRTADVPPSNGFNFDQFAADDFINDKIWAIDVIDVKIAVNDLDFYDISRVFIGIYPDEGRGLPDYNPYDRFNPEPVWYNWYDWESDDPNVEYPEPWLDNPVRVGAVIVNTTGEIDLIPGEYWLTLHFEVISSDISTPPAVWLPGDTDLYQFRSARLFIPGTNPSSGAVNAFGWFWNDLENFGIGALAFSLEGRTTDFRMEVEEWPIRCPLEGRVETTATVVFDEDVDFNIYVEWDAPDGVKVESEYLVLNATYPTTSISARFFSAGNSYPITLRFVGEDGITWTDYQTIKAVSNVLNAPEIIARDEYGLVGGLFQWKSTSFPEYHQIQIIPEGGDFDDPELDVLAEGESYRSILTDWVEGGFVNNFEARDQGNYQLRIRAVNPTCGGESDWVDLFFVSDACEVFTTTLPTGTYNFKKGAFVSSEHVINDFGTITDIRLRVQGFHQKWSDVALALATPVDYLNALVDIPLFSDSCEQDFDSGDFDIRFVLDGSKFRLDICPPPQEGSFYNETLIDPIGGAIFEQFVRGQDKKGRWAVEWLDRGIGFPTNGKIESYEWVLCSIPVPAREHIIWGGESKIRRGTTGVYGS